MPSQATPKRGDIYWPDWNPARGSEQAGRRPGVIVSNKLGNRFSGVVIVAALTTRVPRRAYPFQVRMTGTQSGLPRDSTVRCDQLITVSKDRLERCVRTLPPKATARVDAALKISLQLEDSESPESV